jgi:23S rRNA (adenine2503-C2)-methyltransferase
VNANDLPQEPALPTTAPVPPAVRRSRLDPRPGLSGLDEAELTAWVAAQRQPSYRARQIRDAVWGSYASGPDELRTLPAALRDSLARDFRVDTIVADQVSVADGGLTEKTLHELSDGALVESVLMHYPATRASASVRGEQPARRERHTLCISSQAGCAVGCPFCATGELGLNRDLETAEILDQVRHAARRLAEGWGSGGDAARGAATRAAVTRNGGAATRPGSADADAAAHLTNVVFMGMGEPLLNLDRVLEAVAALAGPKGFGLGARHVVVSTSGVVPGIRRLTALNPQLTLAISLHASRDALRDVLVPLNRRWPIAEVVAAARDHANATGRRVSYEYVMISGVNDTEGDADGLVALLRGDLAHVNLIPMNPVAHTPWQASGPDRIARFAARLRRAGVGATVRANRGVDAGAACGQLAADRAGEPPADAVARRRELIVRRSEAALRGDRDTVMPAGLEAALANGGAEGGKR